METLYDRGLLLGAFILGMLAVAGVAVLVGVVVRNQKESKDNFDVAAAPPEKPRKSKQIRFGRQSKKAQKEAALANAAERGTLGEQDVVLGDSEMAFGTIGVVDDDPGLGMPIAVSEVEAMAPTGMGDPFHYDEPEAEPVPVVPVNGAPLVVALPEEPEITDVTETEDDITGFAEFETFEGPDFESAEVDDAAQDDPSDVTAAHEETVEDVTEESDLADVALPAHDETLSDTLAEVGVEEVATETVADTEEPSAREEETKLHVAPLTAAKPAISIADESLTVESLPPVTQTEDSGPSPFGTSKEGDESW